MSEQNRSTYFCATGWLLIAAVLGFLAVVLGAFGAHGLKKLLETNDMVEVWETAVDYQFWHVLVLLILATNGAELASRALTWACRFFSVGILLFSGSLYLLALGGPKWLGPVTPLGGLCFLVGWVILAVIAAIRLKSRAA